MKPDIRRQIYSEPFKLSPASVRSFEQLIDCNVQAGMKSFHSVFSFLLLSRVMIHIFSLRINYNQLIKHFNWMLDPFHARRINLIIALEHDFDHLTRFNEWESDLCCKATSTFFSKEQTFVVSNYGDLGSFFTSEVRVLQMCHNRELRSFNGSFQVPTECIVKMLWP